MTWTEFEEGAAGCAEGTASREAMRLEPVVPPTVPAPAAVTEGNTPLFDQLARLWQAESRQVPGEPDPEWHALVSRGPGRRRRPSVQRWSARAW
jgi:hypothetical protein